MLSLVARPPSARYRLLPSTATTKDHKKKDPDSQLPEGPLVNHTGEAFLVWAFENAYDRWLNPFKVKREKAAKNLDEAATLAFKEKTKEELKTKYSESKGGKNPYGGVNPQGLQRYQDLCVEIKANREEKKEEIKKLEQEILQLVRKKHGRDAIEKKQAEKKKATAVKVAAPVEDDPNFKENDPDQWW